VAGGGRARVRPFASFDDDSRKTEAISMAKHSDSTAEAAKDRRALGFGGTTVSGSEKAALGELQALLGVKG
jgi:hypothetical protein